MRSILRLLLSLACVAVSWAPVASAASNRTRFSLAGGCFAITAPGDPSQLQAGPFRMKAIRLGEYLVYGKAKDFLATDDEGALTRAGAPGPLTEWRVTADARRGFTMTDNGSQKRLAALFSPAKGCAEYPEAEVNAGGRTFKGTNPTGTVKGVIDTHAHLMGFELFGGDWHCGRPWHPYGVMYALPDCTSLRRGVNGVFADFLENGLPIGTTDRRGWPTFKDWPKPNAVASEGDYYTGIKRAWMGGLRIMVSLSVENESLCAVMTQRRRPCNDMASARAQIRDLYELQDYVDAQAGGPGKGFFRVVTDPLQARRVVNAGKLAVVIGIEVSRVLGCGQHLGVPECDRAQIDSGLRELRALGVTSFFPIHKFDNAFGGTKMDTAETGVIVDAGNLVATGAFWDVETCKTAEHDADQITTPLTTPLADLLAGPLHALLPSGAVAPVYPAPPHCNARDLTDIGRYLIEQMIRQRFIVELDHMDAKTADSVLSVLEQHRYAGVVSGHATPVQLSPQAMPRIYRLGGFVSPTSSYTPKEYLDIWGTTRTARDRRFYSGVGYGSDMNGLAAQSHPGNETGDRITYPFKSLSGGVTFDRERWGQRTFDVNVDGLANYGMYPDWQEQLRVKAGPVVTDDLMRGAEAYLDTWERSQGVPSAMCRAPGKRLGSSGFADIRLGATAHDVLYAAGQPQTRPGRAYRYCVANKGGLPVRVVFGAGEKVVAIVATDGVSVAGGAPGDRARRSGMTVSGPLKRGARLVRRVRGGRVRWVAVVTRSVAGSHDELRSALRAAGVS